jgi:hypothetical protein
MYSPVEAKGVLGDAIGRATVSGSVSAGVGTGDTTIQVAGMGATHTFSPTFVVDGNVGFTRYAHTSLGPDLGKNIGLDVLGIPGTNGTDYRQSGFPIFTINGYEALGNVNNWSPIFRHDNSYTYVANAAWTKGAHNIRFGVDIARYHLNHWQPELGGRSPRGQFVFTGGVTALNGGAGPNQFNSYADLMLGLPQNMGKAYQYLAPMSTREWQDGLYFRDQWQATRNLTVTFGLRWEYFPLMTRAHTGIERYDPDTNTTLIGRAGGNPDGAGTTVSKKYFAPRGGIAYRWGANTVIRAGYGISNDPQFLASPIRDPFPETIVQDIQGANGFAAAGSLAAGLPPASFPDVSSGKIPVPGNILTKGLAAGEFRRGYIQSYNFVVQRQLPGNFAAQAAYVGTHTVRELGLYDINAGLVPGAGLAGAPLYAKFGRIARTQLYLPYGGAHYNSLQAKLDRRFSGGLLWIVSYTYAKSIDVFTDNGGNYLFYVPSQLPRNRAVSNFDRTHVFSMATVWDVPFGKGKHYLSSGLGGKVASGWQINTQMASYTGIPFNVSAADASLGAQFNTQFADQVKPTVTKLGGSGPRDPFYDTSAFARITDARFGNSGRNILRGPGAINLNAGLFRTFNMTEKYKLQFRAECFNFTNTPHFANPNANVSNSNFMWITSTQGSAGEDDQRVWRFALRFSF